MNPTTNLLATRSTAFRGIPTTLRPFLASRYYATQQGLGTTAQGPKRRAVTPFNDNGHVPWKNLSVAEKAARATQQSFNFGMILVGLVLTVSSSVSQLRRDGPLIFARVVWDTFSGPMSSLPIARSPTSTEQSTRSEAILASSMLWVIPRRLQRMETRHSISGGGHVLLRMFRCHAAVVRS